MKNTIKHKLFGMSALFIFGAIPCVANAFTAIAWSQSGQSGGSVKNAPTKDAAISAAIADCKKNGGGSDCQVFKVSDEPGFVALYGTCAKTCGVTAVTGRPTPEQARADAKRECETYYRASCQLAQEWEEAGTSAPKSNDNHLNNKEWKFSQTMNGSMYWHAPSSIRRSGGISRVTIMQKFEKPPSFREIYPKKVSYKTIDYLFNCKAEKLSLEGSRAYFTDGEGNTPDYETKDDPKVIGWHDIEPNSPISNIWQEVCGKPVSRNKTSNRGASIATKKPTSTYSSESHGYNQNTELLCHNELNECAASRPFELCLELDRHCRGH